MSVSRNWKAEAISGIAGFDLIVNGEANTGMLTVEPELYKRTPQGINSSILQLDLKNAADASPENFRSVQYNERLTTQKQYSEVEIFHEENIIERIKVKLIGVNV